MLPLFYGLFSKKTKILSAAFSTKINLDNFIKEFVTWIMVIILTFIIIGLAFKAWIKKPITPVFRNYGTLIFLLIN
jgi:2-hydroxy-3-keto-5-methylthiopentenyl-1-phosphate phosphatase